MKGQQLAFRIFLQISNIYCNRKVKGERKKFNFTPCSNNLLYKYCCPPLLLQSMAVL